MNGEKNVEQELEDLLALVESPGWKRFCQYANSQCGAAAYRDRARRALSSIPADKAADASGYLLQLEARVSEVETLMSWPVERIRNIQGRGMQR